MVALGDDGGALARCVGDTEVFGSRIFGAAPHLWRSGRSFADLLSLADVDRVLTGYGLRTPAVRLVRDGQAVPPHLYTRTARTGRRTVDDVLDVGRLLDLHAAGATVVLQSLQRWWPPLSRFCRELEMALAHPVQANAYLTPAGAAGLAAHHDTHDVFVLQSHGTKRWVVRSPTIEAPLPRHISDPATAGGRPVVLEVDLRPGEALYLPRGTIHAAEAQVGGSLHITVGILATTVHDVLAAVLARAEDGDVRFRRDLPIGAASDAAAATQVVGEAVEHLRAWLATLDVAAVADDIRTRFLANRQPLLEGQLIELQALGALADHTIVQARWGVLLDRRVADDTLTLTLADRHIRMPASLAPAVDRLLDGTPHRVGELSDLLDHPSRLVLVRRLVREGLLRAVTDG